MAQITLYLDKRTAQRLHAAAAEDGVSQSQWVSRLIQARLDSQWPAEVRDLAGSWPDFPSLDEIRGTQAHDVPRESI